MLGDRRTRESLYPVARSLSRTKRDELGLRFDAPVFVQDPFIAKENKELGIQRIKVDWEPSLAAGPTSARIAVVDYNAETNTVAEPTPWIEEQLRYDVQEEAADFKFHQVNVWTIVAKTLDFFENRRVMGRPVPWGFDSNRLLVIPHAGVMRNAFYDRRSQTLQFYYFGTPEAPIFTCLSHDIVAHETGHAILDGIRPYYHEISSVQTAAFHEFLADLTAILAALDYTSVRSVLIEATNGDLTKRNILADLAEEFGKEASARYGPAQRQYLRTAHNKKTMKSVQDETEPHQVSEVMTGAMFDILAQMTELHITNRLKDDPTLAKEPEEFKRIAQRALADAHSRFTRIALRALDFCPPVDVQFIDYARAILVADELAYPVDGMGYRKKIEDCFKARGLADLEAEKPPYSVDLRWKYDIVQMAQSRTAAYHFLNDNRQALRIPPFRDLEIADLYATDKVVEANRSLPREIILEYVWREEVVLVDEYNPGRFRRWRGERIPLLCGGTLVFDDRGNILHWVCKPGLELLWEEETKTEKLSKADIRRREQAERDAAEGHQRKEALLDYVDALIRSGRIGFPAEVGISAAMLESPAVIARHQDGYLRLEMTTSLLHPGEDEVDNEHG